MKFRGNAYIATFLAVLVSGTAIRAQSKSPAVDPSQAEQLVQSCVSNKQFMGVVLVPVAMKYC
jgi:hypothetical protein